MAFWNKGPKPTEVTPPPAPEAPSEEDITNGQMTDALETQGFMPFLRRVMESQGKSLDDLDMSNENSKDILDRFEVFEKSKGISKAIKETLSKEIFKETQINLTGEDLKCVDTFIENEAIAKGPEGGAYLNGLASKLTHFRNNNERIDELNQQIAALETSHEAREQAFEQIEDMGKIPRKIAHRANKMSFGVLMKDQAQAVRTARAQGLNTGDLDAARKAVDSDLISIGRLTHSRDQVHAFRNELLEDIAGGSELIDTVKQKVAAKLTGALKAESSITDLDSAQAHYDSLDPKYRDELEDDFSQELDKMLQEKIKEQAEQAVGRVTTDRKGHLGEMRKKLNSLFERPSVGLGSNKNPEEIKEFVGRTLAEICAKETDDIKKALIRRVCAEHGLVLPVISPHRPTAAEVPAEEAEAPAAPAATAETPATPAPDGAAPEAPAAPAAAAEEPATPVPAAEAPAAPSPTVVTPAAAATTERTAKPADVSWKVEGSPELTLARGRKIEELGFVVPDPSEQNPDRIYPKQWSKLTPEEQVQVDASITREDVETTKADLKRRDHLNSAARDRKPSAQEAAPPAAETPAPDAVQAPPEFVDATDTPPIPQHPEPAGPPRTEHDDSDELPPSFQRAQARHEADRQAQTTGPGNDTAEFKLDDEADNMELKEIPDDTAANMELREMPDEADDNFPGPPPPPASPDAPSAAAPPKDPFDLGPV